MAKFILLYNGPATPMEDMTKEQADKVMAGWTNWMEKVGPKLADIGAPMANGRSIIDDGSTGTLTQLSGYSIIEASDVDEAEKLCDQHPFLSDNTGKFSVEIFELLPIPM